jgi:SAM-dependent methyltransferase
MNVSQYANHLFDENSRNNSWSNMLNFIPRGSRVLDVGCATGNFGEALEQLHDCSVVGVDINADDVVEAQGKISEALVLDISAPEALDRLGKFDVIVFADVLEHLSDPRSALRDAKALLNAGGVVVYSIPHMGHLSVRFNMLEGRFPYTELGLLDRTHLHFYDRNEVDDIFAAAGYRITGENSTLVGYPERWIADKLASLGLTHSRQFQQLLNTTEADVYQFIGQAAPTNDSPTVLSAAANDSASPDELLRRADVLIDENERISQANERIGQEKERMAQENERLRQEINAVQSHLAEIRRNPLKVAARSIIRRIDRK